MTRLNITIIPYAINIIIFINIYILSFSLSLLSPSNCRNRWQGYKETDTL